MSPHTARATLKSVLEFGLLHGGPAALSRRRVSPDCLILAFHNVVPDHLTPAGEHSLHLTRSRFAAFLDILIERTEVVPLEAAIAGAGTGATAGTRPRTAITFDDAYEGALTCGLEELVIRQLPATIFVSPGFIGGDTFWWDELGQNCGGELQPGLRSRALTDWSGLQQAVLAATPSPLPRHPLPEALRATTVERLASAAREGGILFGSHTWSHPNLVRMRGETLDHELTASLRWLHERFENVKPWISYPYGLADEEVCQAAAAAGYEAGFMIAGGWIRDRNVTDRFQLPRLNIPAGLSRNGFALRVSGR